MPYLNKYGEWCAGIGSIGVSWGSVTGVGTVIWPTGGGAHWLDDDNVIGQECIDGVCAIKSWNVRLESEVVLSARGANDLSARSGVWAAWLHGYGVFTSTGLLLPRAGISVTSVGPDGSIAIKPSYSAIGRWDVYEMTGAVWLLTGGDAASIHLLGSRKASWIEGGFPKVTDLVPSPNPKSTPIYWLRMLETPNGWWCLYNVGNDTVLHPVASAEGYIVAQGNAFQPDLMLYAPNVIRVVYSLTAGERPEDIVVLDVDLAAPRVTVASSPLPFIPGLPPPSSVPGRPGGIFSPPRQPVPIVPNGSMLMTSMGEFGVAGLSEELLVAPDEVFPTFPMETGRGRMVHPSLGMYEYEVKPDEWVNIDADAIVPPVWASSRTLTGAANVLWAGNLRDVVVEERWKGEGGISMPIEQLRMLLSFWTTQHDPEEAYVEWYPTYITRVSFKVLLTGLTVGGQNITLDDVVNYRDDRGPDGWVTAPVVLQLRLVARL